MPLRIDILTTFPEMFERFRDREPFRDSARLLPHVRTKDVVDSKNLVAGQRRQ